MRALPSRTWISIGVLAVSVAVALSATMSNVQTKESQAAMAPAKALTALKDGNKRFVAGKSIQKDLPAKVKATKDGQYPFAAVLSCMDSRVPAEIVFDQSIGDFFSIRVAGNVVNTDNLGSLEYAVKVTGVKLIVVMGHTSCGAVHGAIEDVKVGNLTELLAKIQPAVKEAGPGNPKDHAYVDKVGERNVHLAMKQIREKSPVLKEAIDSGAVGLAGGMYDLETGTVTFYAD
ncbi:MAG TPA: carbonic anhydrase family protein [Thermoanaerobaculia bacterium]